MITYVFIPFQIKETTRSYIAGGGKWGRGTSSADRLWPVWRCSGRCSHSKENGVGDRSFCPSPLLILLANSFHSHPSLVMTYKVAGLFVAVDGLQRPSANVLMSVRWQT
jgi:hypothetical protein